MKNRLRGKHRSAGKEGPTNHVMTRAFGIKHMETARNTKLVIPRGWDGWGSRG